MGQPTVSWKGRVGGMTCCGQLFATLGDWAKHEKECHGDVEDWRSASLHDLHCSECCKVFKTPGAFASHQSSKHKQKRPPRNPLKKRHSYPMKFKAAVLAAMETKLALTCTACGTQHTAEVMAKLAIEQPDAPTDKCVTCGYHEFNRLLTYQ